MDTRRGSIGVDIGGRIHNLYSYVNDIWLLFSPDKAPEGSRFPYRVIARVTHQNVLQLCSDCGLDIVNRQFYFPSYDDWQQTQGYGDIQIPSMKALRKYIDTDIDSIQKQINFIASQDNIEVEFQHTADAIRVCIGCGDNGAPIECLIPYEADKGFGIPGEYTGPLANNEKYRIGLIQDLMDIVNL